MKFMNHMENIALCIVNVCLAISLYCDIVSSVHVYSILRNYTEQ